MDTWGLRKRTGGSENLWNNPEPNYSQNTDKQSWGPEAIWCHSDSIERPPANAGVKNLQENNNNNNNTWRLEETCCHSNSSEKPSANIDVKNSKKVNNNYYNYNIIIVIINGLLKTRTYNQQKKKREFAKLWTFLSRLTTE